MSLAIDPSLDLEQRTFQPGTTGWSTVDFHDPIFEKHWNAGRYELIEGIITTMPPAYFSSSYSLGRFIRIIERFLENQNLDCAFSPEVDFVITPTRVVRCDAVFTTTADNRRQVDALASQRNADPTKPSRLLIAPTLIIESISIGHEQHDRDVKRRWYAEAGVENYWIFDAVRRSVEALVLRDHDYQLDCVSQNNESFSPSLFPGLTVSLGSIWFTTD